MVLNIDVHEVLKKLNKIETISRNNELDFKRIQFIFEDLKYTWKDEEYFRTKQLIQDLKELDDSYNRIPRQNIKNLATNLEKLLKDYNNDYPITPEDLELDFKEKVEEKTYRQRKLL